MQAPFGNIWIAYFNKIRKDRNNRIGEGWVDFEREIERVIKQLEKLLLNPTDLNENNSILTEIMGDYFNKPTEIVTQKFLFKLNWDLKVLTLFLEFYLIEEEKKLSIAPKELKKKPMSMPLLVTITPILLELCIKKEQQAFLSILFMES